MNQSPINPKRPTPKFRYPKTHQEFTPPMESELELLSIQHELRSKNTSLSILQQKYQVLTKRFKEMLYNHKTLMSQLTLLHTQNEQQREDIVRLSTELEDSKYNSTKFEDMEIRNKQLEKEMCTLKCVKKKLENLIQSDKEFIDREKEAMKDKLIKRLKNDKSDLEKISKRQFDEYQEQSNELVSLKKKLESVRETNAKLETKLIEFKSNKEKIKGIIVENKKYKDTVKVMKLGLVMLQIEKKVPLDKGVLSICGVQYPLKCKDKDNVIHFTDQKFEYKFVNENIKGKKMKVRLKFQYDDKVVKVIGESLLGIDVMSRNKKVRKNIVLKDEKANKIGVLKVLIEI